MSELIPLTLENETTPERFAWDNVLRALDKLSDIDDSFGLFETIEELRDEDLEDALMRVFNYAVAIDVPEGQSSKLDRVMQMLEDYGLIEGWEDDDEI